MFKFVWHYEFKLDIYQIYAKSHQVCNFMFNATRQSDLISDCHDLKDLK